MPGSTHRGGDQAMLDTLQERRRPPRTHRLRWFLLGEHVEPHPARIRLYEQLEEDRDDVGICCSGGGIRSAAFNLGALQALQDPDRPVLQNAKYLTAVSGGSYMAAAFCMVAKTGGEDDSDPALVTDAAPPFHPGSPEEQYLRNHLSYLAPDGTARVYLALRMLAGMTINTLLLGLPVFVLGLLVGWFARSHYGDLERHAEVPGGVVIAVVVLAGLALALTLLDVLWRARHETVRRAIATWEVRLFLLACGAAAVLVLVPWLASEAMQRNTGAEHAANPSIGTALLSMLSLFAAALGHIRGHVKDASSEVSRLGKYVKPVRDAVIAVVVTLAGPLLLLSITVLGTIIAIYDSPLTWVIVSSVLLAAMWFWVDLMAVSLHPFYRRRLASAFALKRVWVSPDGKLGRAPEEPRNGIAEARERDYDRIVALSDSSIEPGPITRWPTLVVCAAANVSDPGATPPGRAVASFTFSARAIGGPLTGAVETEVYETQFGRNRRRDVTLLAAVAMSGAALSPAMGKLTYRPLKFLLAMTNVRLGVWVPNPMHALDRDEMNPSKLPFSDDDVRKRNNVMHRPRAQYLWKEVLGRNRLEDRFLYVTDGGHYENLGLVELLRRGCRTVYCFDAGGGTGSPALGDAIALARNELGVDIEMMPDETAELAEDEHGRSKRVCARGRIRFPACNGTRVEGTLFYVRSVLSEDAPWELRNFQSTDALFPHHSTFDQFFNDQKFEAYRLLGANAARNALALPVLHLPGLGGGGGPVVEIEQRIDVGDERGSGPGTDGQQHLATGE